MFTEGENQSFLKEDDRSFLVHVNCEGDLLDVFKFTKK